MTQDRLETSWNWRPMVGSAVATMVWSCLARNIVSSRLIRMVRTSAWDSGGRVGAIGGASVIAAIRAGRSESFAAMSAGKAVEVAGLRLCLRDWFISGMFLPGAPQSQRRFANL